MSAHTTISTPTRARRAWLLAAAAAAAVAAASTLLAIGVGPNREQNAAVPSAKEQRHAERVAALTTEQLAAAFGAGVYSTGPIWTTGLTLKERRYVEAITALTPAEIAAAFGTEATATMALGAKERRYVEEIAGLTPAERAAAFGTGR
jgi:hypothetical protein